MNSKEGPERDSSVLNIQTELLLRGEDAEYLGQKPGRGEQHYQTGVHLNEMIHAANMCYTPKPAYYQKQL